MADTWKIVRNLWDTFDNNPANQRTVDAMKGMFGLLPAGAGDVASGLLAADDVRRGDYTSAALNGVGVLPFIPSMAGMVKGKGDDIAKAIRQPTKYEQAHEVARQNAVKMLGLPENNTAMDRAKALGFSNGWYHGTRNNVEGGLMATGENTGAESAKIASWITDSPETAETYAGAFPDMYGEYSVTEGSNILPLMVRDNYPGYLYLTGDARKNGFDGPIGSYENVDEMLADAKHFDNKGVRIKNLDDQQFLTKSNWTEPSTHMGVFDPSNIRSRFAAFDPARINEPDLLGRVNPELLPWLTGAGLLGAGGMYYSGE